MDKNSFPKRILPENFPSLLKLIPNAPKELYILGKIPKGTPIAFIGTRRPSPFGKECCRQLIASLKNTDAIIVSGLAQGIDSFCHEAALDYDLPTIAVLAQGLNAKIHGDRKILAENIIRRGGGLISENPNDTPGYKTLYPARNRIIAGLSKAVVVVESKIKGGSMLTIDFAEKYNRPIFALSGNYLQETAKGPLQLLRTGRAKPIYFPEDLKNLCEVSSLHSEPTPTICSTKLSQDAQKLYREFAGSLKTLTELGSQSGLVMNSLFAILTELELAGFVSSEDGFRYFFEKEFS